MTWASGTDVDLRFARTRSHHRVLVVRESGGNVLFEVELRCRKRQARDENSATLPVHPPAKRRGSRQAIVTLVRAVNT